MESILNTDLFASPDFWTIFVFAGSLALALGLLVAYFAWTTGEVFWRVFFDRSHSSMLPVSKEGASIASLMRDKNFWRARCVFLEATLDAHLKEKERSDFEKSVEIARYQQKIDLLMQEEGTRPLLQEPCFVSQGELNAPSPPEHEKIFSVPDLPHETTPSEAFPPSDLHAVLRRVKKLIEEGKERHVPSGT